MDWRARPRRTALVCSTSEKEFHQSNWSSGGVVWFEGKRWTWRGTESRVTGRARSTARVMPAETTRPAQVHRRSRRNRGCGFGAATVGGDGRGSDGSHPGCRPPMKRREQKRRLISQHYGRRRGNLDWNVAKRLRALVWILLLYSLGY